MKIADLSITIYADDGVVYVAIEDDGAEVEWPMEPALAEEFFERGLEAVKDARKQKPKNVQ